MSVPVFVIEATKVSPFVSFDPANHRFEISGRAITSNAATFFEPVIEWLQKELTGFPVELRLQLDYFNTSSHKYILNIIKELALLHPENTVRWIFDQDDDEMLDMGKKLQLLSKANFVYEEV